MRNRIYKSLNKYVITALIPKSAAHRLADRRSLGESDVLEATEAMKQVVMATLWWDEVSVYRVNRMPCITSPEALRTSSHTHAAHK